MLRIYQRMGQVNWAEQWQYRANLFMYILYGLITPIVYIAVWTSIANAQGSVGGLTANDFIVYYMIMLLVDQVTGETVVYNFAYKIQDGSLSSEIILPVHPLLTRTLMNNLAFKVMTTFVLIPVWLLLSLLFQPTFASVTLTNVLLAIPSLIFGFRDQLPAQFSHCLRCILDDTRLGLIPFVRNPSGVILRSVCSLTVNAKNYSDDGNLFAFPIIQIFSNPIDFRKSFHTRYLARLQYGYLMVNYCVHIVPHCVARWAKQYTAVGA